MRMRDISLWKGVALTVLLLTLVSLLAPAAQAQDASPAADRAANLMVSLRTEQDVPVAGAMIIVRNADIDGEIGRVPTTTDGMATIPLPTGVQTIRVNVTGQLSSGTPFTHQAADTGGILFFPGPLGETHLDLLVTAAGLVLPDPRMWTLDPVPATAATMLPFAPTRRVATPPVIEPATGPTRTRLAPTPTRWMAATPVIGDAHPAPAESQGSGAGGMVLLLIAGLCMVGGIVCIVRRGR